MVTGRIDLQENVTKAAQRIADELRRSTKAHLDADKATKEMQRAVDALRRATKVKR